MPYLVRMTESAREDSLEIGQYIAENDSPSRARYVVERIEERVASLAEFPERGALVGELLDMGISGFREVRFQPYRIIYQVSDNEVQILLIADGRRNMHSLLIRRLLQG